MVQSSRLRPALFSSIVHRLESDLHAAIMAALEGRLAEVSLSFDDSTAVSVVMASSGYPEAYETGHKISGLGNLKEGKVFHSGTKTIEGVIKTAWREDPSKAILLIVS